MKPLLVCLPFGLPACLVAGRTGCVAGADGSVVGSVFTPGDRNLVQEAECLIGSCLFVGPWKTL